MWPSVRGGTHNGASAEESEGRERERRGDGPWPRIDESVVRDGPDDAGDRMKGSDPLGWFDRWPGAREERPGAEASLPDQTDSARPTPPISSAACSSPWPSVRQARLDIKPGRYL